ncbi:metal ABC transporter permease [Nissabacter sp. SGAir0207]|uniref:metal ABC transporter permease n=1 Tax=Nissabacter sp. SGAir0207 TaxID=2126321 RepID=UPI0010CD23CE|nr:metal ABC transporter permease [Nissabacter sp. SGAir0207]QCR36879.1 iron ABC transporter [Nissabacter sp. SGAir0207]
MIVHLLLDPFLTFGFMRRALVACLTLSLSATPLGVFLLLRRMSLAGDALSHAVLPGAAIGYLISGMSLVAMGVGGFIAGLAVAMLSGWVSRHTSLKEDASFAGFYLGSLALGVTLVSLRGSSVDLLHVLFGSILAVDAPALRLVGGIATLSLLLLALLYRALVMESFDQTFLRLAAGCWVPVIHALFLALVVINLVAGFQILGTLMSVGLMMLPAASARLWTRNLPATLLTAAGLGMVASLAGLLWSYYASLPAGPAIVLSASLLFLLSVLFGSCGGIFAAARPALRHQ